MKTTPKDATQWSVRAMAAAQTIAVNGYKVTYQRFLAPTMVISPRIFRLGVKFSF
jgi:hypothetical protein